MIVFIAGMARSGSMWAYNVTRAVLAETGEKVLPEDAPPDETEVVYEALSNNQKKDGIYVIKTHRMLKPGLPDVKVINTYRDVRESMLSFMRFTKCDFERALTAAREMMVVTDFYTQRHKDNIIHLRYEHINSDPVGQINKIREFLGVEMDDVAVCRVAEEFSRSRLKELMDRMSSVQPDEDGKIDNGNGAFQTVLNFSGGYRVYHKKTGFQSNHVTTRGDEWREAFTGDQLVRIHELTAPWLKKYGYEV